MEETKLTADEISLYDRQIRLWGVEAQTNLRNADILVINLTGVAVEIVKNLTLGGVGSLTVMDDSKILDQDLNSNFFIQENQIGELKVEAARDRMQDMNPRVKLSVDSRNWERDINDASFFQKFRIIVATGLNSAQISKLNSITRNLEIPLIVCSCHGMFGFIFNDLIQCQSWIKLEKNDTRKVGDSLSLVSKIVALEEVNENDVDLQKILVENTYRKWDDLSGQYLNQQYPTDKKKNKKISKVLIAMLSLLSLPETQINKPIEEVTINKDELLSKVNQTLSKFDLPEILKMDQESLDLFIRHAYCEFQPTNSIIGGVVSQDIINTLVRKELPINNVCVLDGFNADMPVYYL